MLIMQLLLITMTIMGRLLSSTMTVKRFQSKNCEFFSMSVHLLS